MCGLQKLFTCIPASPAQRQTCAGGAAAVDSQRHALSSADGAHAGGDLCRNFRCAISGADAHLDQSRISLMCDGEFELVTLKNGARAVRHLGHGEVMHPAGGPWAEANRLYV